MTAGQLALPDGAKLLTPGDTVVVQCVEVLEEPDEEEEAGVPTGAAEPEIIGRKPEDEDGGE